MATIRKTIASATAPDGVEVAPWFEYDDQNLRVTAVGCNNQSDYDALVEASLMDGSRSQQKIFLAGTDTSIAVPTGAAQRLQLVVTPKGSLNNVEFRMMVPFAP